MQRFSRLTLGVLIALIVIVLSMLLRWWQGPIVLVQEVTAAPLVQSVVVAGRVTADTRVQVSSEVLGIVQQRWVHEGEQVQKGQPLLTLGAAEFTAQVRQLEVALAELTMRTQPQALADLEQARTELAQAQREANRRAELLELGVIPPESYEQAKQLEHLARLNVSRAEVQAQAVAAGGTVQQTLEQQLAAAQALLAKTQITAPVDGLLLTRHVDVGDVAQPGQVLLTLAAAGPIEVRADIDERNLRYLALGQAATVIADAYPEQPFSAVVSYIAPVIDATRGTVEVRLALEQPLEFLRQDMTVSVTIEVSRRDNALVIPNEALYSSQSVWVVRHGKLQQQVIRVGVRGLTHSEVTQGLQQGEQVVINTPFTATEGLRVRAQVVD